MLQKRQRTKIVKILRDSIKKLGHLVLTESGSRNHKNLVTKLSLFSFVSQEKGHRNPILRNMCQNSQFRGPAKSAKT